MDSTPPTSDAVNPSHYQAGQLQAIDVIDNWQLGFNLGNVVKYVLRAGKKDGADYRTDLEKALWYLQRELGKEPPQS
jgi:hypothetical protein